MKQPYCYLMHYNYSENILFIINRHQKLQKVTLDTVTVKVNTHVYITLTLTRQFQYVRYHQVVRNCATVVSNRACMSALIVRIVRIRIVDVARVIY